MAEEKDLTTKQMAAALAEQGVEANDAKVSRIENGQAEPSLSYVIAAAQVGNVSLDWLVRGVGDRGRANDVIDRLRLELQKAEADYVVQSATALSAEDALLAAQEWGLQNPDAKRRHK